jgi:holo-[acyl-carrier protein] synthase
MFMLYKTLIVKKKMILGTGIDSIEISRIKLTLEKHGMRFLHRCFSASEIMQSDAMNSSELVRFCAKRFAAKEAVAKAIGCGFGQYISFTDVAISNNHLGKPFVVNNQRIADAVKQLHGVSEYILHLSMNDNINYATAFVVLDS